MVLENLDSHIFVGMFVYLLFYSSTFTVRLFYEKMVMTSLPEPRTRSTRFKPSVEAFINDM